MVGIATAAMHARDEQPAYPLAGLISSGMGDTQSALMKSTTPSYALVDEDHALMPAERKDVVMFKPGTYDPEMLKETERLNAVAPLAELAESPTKWMSC